MKISIFIIISSLFIQHIALTQWIQQNSGVSTPLYNIQFINRFTGWATGGNSVILKTTDEGNNWFNQSIDLGFTKNLYGLYILNENTGYIAGWFETILKTTNGGNNWLIISNIPTNNGNSNHSCFFIDEQTGWVSGSLGRVLKTTNAGVSWDTANVGNDGPLREIKFLNLLTGWVCGDGGNLRKSTNGGLNWFGFPLLTTANLSGMHFLSKDTGWVVSEQDNYIFRTTNGGGVWDTIAQLPGGNLQYSYSIYFTGPLTGYVGGTFTRLFKTVNGGYNWYRDSISNLGFINNFSFYNDTIGWAVAGNRIIHTTTGGSYLDIEPISTQVPETFTLEQNYPNPFNPITEIKFSIPNSVNGHDRSLLVIYDVLGRIAAELVNEELNPGNYKIKWDASEYPSGVYFYKLTYGSKTLSKKMVLIK